MTTRKKQPTEPTEQPIRKPRATGVEAFISRIEAQKQNHINSLLKNLATAEANRNVLNLRIARYRGSTRAVGLRRSVRSGRGRVRRGVPENSR